MLSLAEVPSLRVNKCFIMCIYHSIFINPYMNACVSPYCILAIINIISLDIGMLISLQYRDFDSLDKYPEVRLVDHVLIFFNILETSRKFSKVAASI